MYATFPKNLFESDRMGKKYPFEQPGCTVTFRWIGKNVHTRAGNAQRRQGKRPIYQSRFSRAFPEKKIKNCNNGSMEVRFCLFFNNFVPEHYEIEIQNRE